jgi:hypothetical protein
VQHWGLRSEDSAPTPATHRLDSFFKGLLGAAEAGWPVIATFLHPLAGLFKKTKASCQELLPDPHQTSAYDALISQVRTLPDSM